MQDSKKYEYIPSVPHQDIWEQRRNIYDQIWFECINEKGSFSNQHVGSLKWELERCFCAGAWVATVAIAVAIVEVHLSHIGQWKMKPSCLDELNAWVDWDWLRNRRNKLLHGERHSKDFRLSSEEYRRDQDKLQLDAERAVKLALKVALNNPPFR